MGKKKRTRSDIHASKQRTKWKKKTTQILIEQTNPLIESRNRVLPILPTQNKIEHTKPNSGTQDAMNVNLNEEQKQEFASLFTNILKTVIHNETNSNKESKAAKNLITKPIAKEEEMDEEKATKKKLSPITKRNQDEIEQKKQYLEPLDEVADIILDDLIHEVSNELD